MMSALTSPATDITASSSTVNALSEADGASPSGKSKEKLAEPVLADGKDWLRDYLEEAKNTFEERFKTNPSSEDTVKNFTIGKMLGAGSFGKVVLATHNHDASKRPCAIKILNKERVVKTKQIEHTISEKRLLQASRNPFIVKMIKAFQDTTNLYMVMEFANGGELFTLIRKKGRFSEVWAQFYSAQVVLALQYLHNVNILYRDLKPENILIDSIGYCKLADFGFAKRAHQTWTLCGTPQYLAPEMILNKGYGKSVDYWGFGVLIYEMLAGFVPFDHKTPIKLYEMIVECNLTFPSHFKAAATDLLKKIIQTDVTKRYGNLKDGAFDIIYHSWYKEVDFRKIMKRAYQAPWIPTVKSATDTAHFEKFKDEALVINKTDKYPQEFANF